jgi:hypothetical protein
MYDITRVYNPNETIPAGPTKSGKDAIVDSVSASASAARTTRQAISAKLIRRLAAAADGHRDGREIFFMARFEAEDDGDFDLDGPFTRDQLDKLRVPEGFGIFGPYQTDACVDDISRTPVKKITIELHGGETFSFEGTRFDALFWSVSALEKFAIPHYTNVRGVDKAQHILRRFVETDVFLLAHDPNTEETMIGVTPGPGGPGEPQTIAPL